jgi:hypothetical protein
VVSDFLLIPNHLLIRLGASAAWRELEELQPRDLTARKKSAQK